MFALRPSDQRHIGLQGRFARLFRRRKTRVQVTAGPSFGKLGA
jgi:hypothetical protein